MAEVTSNVEFAQKIHEHGHRTSGPSSGMEAWFEIVEVALLAIVAVMTAWSSYQAARWDALSAKSYAMATRTTVVAQEKTTLAGHERIYDMMGARHGPTPSCRAIRRWPRSTSVGFGPSIGWR